MDNTHKARNLRRNSTEAERAFWNQVRAKRLAGYSFRRQVPIGPYIVDFVCPAVKLVVELDGGQHQEQTAADNRRTRWLEREGYRVLRVWNNDVLGNMDGVLIAVLAELRSPRPLAWSPRP